MKITSFKGITPRTSPRLLEDSEAQIAANTNLASGEMRPLSIPGSPYVTTKVGPLLALYKADSQWFTWPYDVDVCRSPLPGEIKFIYSGDGEPRITTNALASSGGGVDNFPSAARGLGVPKPLTAPAVSVSGGVLADVSRYYLYSFYDDWNQESAYSPLSARVTGKPDGTWAISAMDAAPVSSGAAKAYFSTDSVLVSLIGASGAITGATNATPIVITDVAHGLVTGNAVNINAVGGNTAANNSHANPYWVVTVLTVDTYSLTGSAGNGAYTAATGNRLKASPHWMRAGEQVVLSATTLAVASAPAIYTIKVAGDYSAATSWARKAPWGTCTKRLYRTSGTKSQFQLVATGTTATTYSDTILDVNIPGDEAISANWELPPVGLKGVFTLPSGAIAGFSGNELCLSEPFQPHAWPPEYRMRSEYPIVAAAMFTSGIVLGTTGEPVVVLGHEPGQMMAQPTKAAYPCASKRSMVSLGDRVGYATAHGYATVGDNGVELMTVGNYTRDDWSKLTPATMIADSVRGRLYIMTRGQGTKLLIFDYLDGTGLTTSDIDATEIFADALTGKLFVSDALNKDVREFDPVDGVFMTMDWMSKEFVVPEPMNIGAARINFVSRWDQATYDSLLADFNAAVAANNAALATADGAFNADEFNVREVNGSSLGVVRAPDLEAPGVTFTLYVDGVVVFSQVIPNSKAFALPSGYRSDTYTLRVQGQSVIKSIDFAQTMLGLKNA